MYFYTIKFNGEKIKEEVELPNHKVAFEILVDELKKLEKEYNCLTNGCNIGSVFLRKLS